MFFGLLFIADLKLRFIPFFSGFLSKFLVFCSCFIGHSFVGDGFCIHTTCFGLFDFGVRSYCSSPGSSAFLLLCSGLDFNAWAGLAWLCGRAEFGWYLDHELTTLGEERHGFTGRVAQLHHSCHFGLGLNQLWVGWFLALITFGQWLLPPSGMCE